MNCGRCHECGASLRIAAGGGWCRCCRALRRYLSHGATGAVEPQSERCPDWKQIIVGRRDPRDGIVVQWGNEELFPTGKHSSQFEWGYGGSGPAELAWAILSAVAGVEAAEENYQSFKWEFIANLPFQSWKLDVNQILAWLKARTEMDGKVA